MNDIPKPAEEQTIPWSKPEHVPGPVCWLRYCTATDSQQLITNVDACGIILQLGDSRDPELTRVAWDVIVQFWRYSTDRQIWFPCVIPPADELAKAAGPAPEETAQDIAPGHNPDRLSREQVGEGWRLLEDDEVGDLQVPLLPSIERWRSHDKCWDDSMWWGRDLSETFRTRLTRAALRAARGLPPEQEGPDYTNAPVTPAPDPANPCRDEAAVRELVNIIGEPEACRKCNGAGTFMDTTYDRTGAETSCGHCEGAGVIFNFNAKSLANALAAIRATSGPKPEGRES